MYFSTGPSQKVKFGPVSICHSRATKTNFNSLVNKEKQMKSATKAFIPNQISNRKSDATSVRRVPQAPSVHTSPSPSSHFLIPFFYSWELATTYLESSFSSGCKSRFLGSSTKGNSSMSRENQLLIRLLWRSGW